MIPPASIAAADGQRAGSRPRRSDLLLAVIPVVVAWAAHAWVRDLTFQLDDHALIVDAGSWTERMSDSVSPGADPPAPAGLLSRLFRPVVWSLFVLERHLGPEPIDPRIFHTTSLAIHALNTMLVGILLRVLGLGRLAALFGTVVFAINAAGAQAVSWISARGDLLQTTFLLLAGISALRARIDRPAMTAMTTGILTALAVLSKEPAVVFAPLTIGIVCWRLRHVAGVRSLALAGLPVLVAWTARTIALGTAGPSYIAGGSVGWELLPRTLEHPSHLLDLLIHLLAPWDPRAPVTAAAGHLLPVAGILGLAPAAFVATALALAAVVMIALASRPAAGLRRYAIPALVVILGSLPVMYLWKAGEGSSLSRTLYVLGVPLAAFWAALMDTAAKPGAGRAAPVGRATPVRRAAAGVLAAIVLGIAIDALGQMKATQTAVAEGIRNRLALIESVAAGHPPETLHVVVDPDGWIRGQPALGPMIGWALRPPFHRSHLRIKHAHDLLLVLHSGVLVREPSPLRVLAATGDGIAALTPLLPALPAPGSPPPEFREEGDGWFRPRTPVPARAVPGLRIRWPAPSGGASVRIRIVADGREFLRILPAPPGGDPDPDSFLYLDGDPTYLVSPRLDGISLEASPLPPGRPDLVVLAPGVTDLDVLAPDSRARMTPAAFTGFEVRGLRPGSRPRVRLLLHGVQDPPMALGRWNVPVPAPSPAHLRPGDAAWTLSASGEAVAWSGIWSRILESLDASLTKEVALSWRAEAEGGTEDTEIGRSPWCVLRLAR